MDTTIQCDVEAATHRVYDAEWALHVAHQTGVDHWVNAAADRLHEAIVAYQHALQASPRAD